MRIDAQKLNDLIGEIWRVQFKDPDELWNYYYDNLDEACNVVISTNLNPTNITASGPFKVKF